jgi:hypothetical protein
MAHGNFDNRQSNRPHIRGDGVRSNIILRLSLDTLGLERFSPLVCDDVQIGEITHSHVTLTTDVGFGQGFLKMS